VEQKLNEAEREQRISALMARLRLEEFTSECLALAAPYINAEDKVGWKVGDALKFLQSEIDPKFLTGRLIAISPQVPDTEVPSVEDYEQLEWSQPVAEPDVNLRRLAKYWNSMGKLLHRDLLDDGFDIEKAQRGIEAANKFCDALTTGMLFINAPIQTVERTCSEGHLTKRNEARLKPGQIIPCMNHQCRIVFSVESIAPLVWKEFDLQFKCVQCGSLNSCPKILINLSYWEKASVSCTQENCHGQTEVRWLLSSAIRKEDEG
jgi:hypothetical protein